MNKFKQLIKNNYLLQFLVCKMSKLLNSIINYNSFGNNAQLNINNFVIFKNVKFKIIGNSNSIIFEKGVVLRNIMIEIKGNNNLIKLGESVKFYENGKILIEGDNCKVEINNFTTIGSASLFCEESNTIISIGNDCMFSRDITIQTGDFHSIINNFTNKRINKSESIFIGNHVWIGNNATILKGSQISDNSIVGINALVNKKFIEKNSIIAGIPAKVLKNNINWDRKKLPII